ncbi:hypothetical protein RJ639_016931 [Escallonia herrerae]|uniref:Uncharacterized protein n=1 Tax=Escallonia herrerae TaxID=1293975 RepID=A0AA89AKH5_9ASTE|nr:hypothetical protein RJ639_016931 [Escallonia herrerae]
MMPSFAPSKENGKKNEDPVSKRGRLLGFLRQMINEDTAIHADPRGSVQLPATCIFKVPDELREPKASAYTPRVVSLGPLHKDDKHWHKGMDGHKKRYMHRLFLRSRSTDEAVEADIVKTENICVDAMLEIVDEARAYYDASHGLCEDDDVKFAEMLILDGCSQLELFYKVKIKEGFSDDPLLSNVLRQNNIIHDLVLLENQTPFLVLEKLFECTLKRIEVNPPSSLTVLVLDFFEKAAVNIFGGTQMKKKDPPTSNHHVLGLLHSYLLLLDKRTEKKRSLSSNTLQPNLTELETISRRFGIPKLCIFYDTETLLRNLIAFEQLCPDIKLRHITSYAFLMDTLIDTKEDVHLLETAGVIENNLGSGEDASDLFNNLCKNVVLGDFFFFFSQWKQVDDYYNQPWPKVLSLLRRNYFSNPWTGISVIAALILFALTVVQTVYNIRSSP